MKNKMFTFYNKYIKGAEALWAFIVACIPEALLGDWEDWVGFSQPFKAFLARMGILGLLILLNCCRIYLRQRVQIGGYNYCIQVEYGDIFKMANCKKVIPFDECFTTTVGRQPGDIKESSVCGQYLSRKPITEQEMQNLINLAELNPQKKKSQYKSKIRYESGKLVPRGDDMLLSFAKLDKDGLGELTREEYLKSLSLLWQEINKRDDQKNVCMPILGSGVTRIGDKTPTQQELLDIMILSYKLSAYKLKNPRKLCIVCKKQDGFSLDKIGESL